MAADQVDRQTIAKKIAKRDGLARAGEVQYFHQDPIQANALLKGSIVDNHYSREPIKLPIKSGKSNFSLEFTNCWSYTNLTNQIQKNESSLKYFARTSWASVLLSHLVFAHKFENEHPKPIERFI